MGTTIMINGVECNSYNGIKELAANMWFKTKSGATHQVKYIDVQHPHSANVKFAIVYSTDNKTCWGMDKIVQASWNPDDLKGDSHEVV